MLKFLCINVKNCTNVASNSKKFMKMFPIYFENMWYDLDEYSEDNIFKKIISSVRTLFLRRFCKHDIF